MAEIPYRRLVLPELVWMAVLNDRLGTADGTKAAMNVAQFAAAIEPKGQYGLVSSYLPFTREQMLHIGNQRDAIPAVEALLGFFSLYPECPLAALADEKQIEQPTEATIAWFSDLLVELFDNESKPAVSMQANAIYIAFVTDRLKVFRGLALANFPEIENYPETDESRRIASSIRATLNLFLMWSVETSDRWPRYFWNRGLDLGSCVGEAGEELEDE